MNSTRNIRTWILNACCLIVISMNAPSAAHAAPLFQDPTVDAKALEAMILKQVEDAKKQREAEQAKNSANNPAGNVPKFGGSPSVPTVRTEDSSNKSPYNRGRRDYSAARQTPDSPNSALQNLQASPSINPSEVGNQVPRVRPTEKVATSTEYTDMVETDAVELDPGKRIVFNFEQEEWKDVIEWFADQIGFGVFFGPTGPPQGTLTYYSTIEWPVIEALDFLNSRLALLQPSHVLVRHGNQLVLVNESGTYPDQLIARIWEEDLDDYGDYEVVSCVFDLGGLEGNSISLQLREDVSEVHIDGFAYFQPANRLTVRERVRVLKRFRDLINFAKKKESVITILTYVVKHVEPEVLLVNLRQLMGFPDDTNVLPDGSLSFSVQPLGNSIYLKGNPDKIEEFKRIAALIDIPIEQADGIIEKPYFKVYRVNGDPAVFFQVLQTLLDGEPNVKLDQDKTTGGIFLWAIQRVHDFVGDLLNSTNAGDSFDMVVLKNVRPMEAVDTVEELLGISSLSENATGPKLVADSDNERVLVHGTPQEIVMVRNMLEKIDSESTSSVGPRTPARIIRTSPRQGESIMNILQTPGIMDSLGRNNRLNLILPSDRGNFRNRGIDQYFQGKRMQFEEQQKGNDSGADSDEGMQRTNESRKDDRRFETTRYAVPSAGKYVRTSFTQDEATSDDGNRDDSADETQQPADPTEVIGQPTAPGSGNRLVEIPSVPGAPVEVRLTDIGIVVYSEDLDAADDVEAMIKDFMESEGENDLPTFFYLQFRKANEAKSLLDSVLGLSSSSSGGSGGGIGAMIGGALQNAVGGAAGDMLGGLMGGGDSGSSGGPSAIELEGENVQIGVDIKQNVLIVTGASSNDLNLVAELIDAIDVPGPPHDPLLAGMTYSIPIKHRDPMYVKEIVETQLAEYINKPNASGGNNQQNVEQALQQQIVQQLQGGRNRGRGNSNNNEAEKPKATLGVDEINRTLLVTGPEFIYKQVLSLVEQVDLPQDIETLSLPTPISPMATVRFLEKIFGKENIILEEGEEPESKDQNNRTPIQNQIPQRTFNRGGNANPSGNARGGFNVGGNEQSSRFNRGQVEQALRDAFRNQSGGQQFIPLPGRGDGGGR